MWTDESVRDAMQVLLDSGSVQKVKSTESTYVLADEVVYTNPLYLHALDQLVQSGKLKVKSQTGERSIFERADRGFDRRAV